MADRPNPYVQKQPGDIIRSGDWNELQVRAREELQSHAHQGGSDGMPIPREGIAERAIDGSRIDPATRATLTGLTVSGDLKVGGTAALGDFPDLRAAIEDLRKGKADRAGDSFAGNLEVKGSLTLGETGAAGLGLRLSTIQANGAAADQDLNLIPKGKGKLTLQGAVACQGSLSFGQRNGQLLTLYENDYGLGIQSSTAYFRTGKNFAWFTGGSHQDGELDPGRGGTLSMVLQEGRLGIGTAPDQGYALDVNGPVRLRGSLKVEGNLSGQNTRPLLEQMVHRRILFGLAGDAPINYGSTWIKIRDLYGPFEYAVPPVQSGAKRRFRLYAIYTDTMTSSGEHNVLFAMENGRQVVFTLDLTWGALDRYRDTYSSWFDGDPPPGHGSLKIRTTVEAGGIRYLELQTWDVFTR